MNNKNKKPKQIILILNFEIMHPIIVIDNYKDLIIIVLSSIIFIKIVAVMAYYKGLRDCRDTINWALGSDINNYKKINS